MKHEILLFLAASLMLALALVVRGRLQDNYFRFALISVGAFIVAQVLIHTLTDAVQWQRRSSIEGVLQGLLQDNRQGDRLLLVGSSYTARAIDDAVLEQELEQNNAPLLVQLLSYPGVFAFEQDLFLERYLEQSQQRPAIVLIELGSELIATTAKENSMTSKTLRYHDTKRVAMMLHQVIYRMPRENAAELIPLSAGILARHLAHLFNLGILLHIEDTKAAKIRRGFLPDDEVAEGFDIEEARRIIQARRQRSGRIGLNTEIDAYSALIEFRRTQARRLETENLQPVMFYDVPSLDDTRLARTDALCRALGQYCIALDPGLWNLLDETMWTDMGHLNTEGGRVFVASLARRLVDKLGAGNALQ